MSRMDNQRLRDLLDTAMGEPPRQVTVEAVRRRATRRRALGAISGAAAVVALAGVGIAAASQVLGPGRQQGAGPGGSSAAGVPEYYMRSYSYSSAGLGAAVAVVRATATGVVTARARCPWARSTIADIAATSSHAFFMICEREAPQDRPYAVSGSRVYLVQLTRSGKISGYSPVRGGVLGHSGPVTIAAVPDGTQIAVTRGRDFRSPRPLADEVIIINTRTGARAIWRGGGSTFQVFDAAFSQDGRELEFVGCIKVCGDTVRGGSLSVRAIGTAAPGGQLGSSRLLLNLSAQGLISQQSVFAPIITTGGTTLTAIITSPSSSVLRVVEYSIATGRQLGILYTMRDDLGGYFNFLGADPTGRHCLFSVSPPGPTVDGWLSHGRVLPLKPVNDKFMLTEIW